MGESKFGKGKRMRVVLGSLLLGIVSFSPAFGILDLARNEYMITDNGCNPTINDGYVVWQSQQNGSWDIYARDLSTGSTFLVCGEVGDQIDPAELRFAELVFFAEHY